MPLEKQIGDAATALSQNQYVDALDGTYWVSGWDATIGTGDLEVDIAPGEGAINTGSVETAETQTVDFTGDVDADDPRKAVISVDDTGTVQKTLGDPVAAAPVGEVRERTFDPAPPTNAPGVVVAEVWIGAGATALVSADVRDRRVGNSLSDFEGTPNVPNWQEDSNSPFTPSDRNSDVLLDLADTYDIWRFEFIGSSGGGLDIRINGDSGNNYDGWKIDGRTSVTDDFIAAGNLSDATHVCHISGTWNFNVNYNSELIGAGSGTISNTDAVDVAVNGDVDSPLTDITLVGGFDGTIRAYGKNIE